MAGWHGARWVEFFEGEVGQPVRAVLLGHSHGEGVVIVRTAPRERWDRLMSAVETTGPQAFAQSALASLVDRARPAAVDDAFRSLYNRGIWPLAAREANPGDRWEWAEWSLDGRPMTARVYRFGHVWTGLSTEDRESYIGVTACGLNGTEVNLGHINGGDYGFDFTIPFDSADLTAAHERHPNERLGCFSATPVTSDHRRVVDTDLPPNYRVGGSR